MIKLKSWLDYLSLHLIWAWFITKELWFWLECQIDGDEWLWPKPTISECFEYGEDAFNEYIKEN